MKTFALICDSISKTTKKLEKERILSEYLRSLNDSDLAVASVFFTGSPFPLRDQRTTNVGFAVVRDAIFEMYPDFRETLGAVLLRTGDAGTAIAELFAISISDAQLTLNEVREYFDRLSIASGNLAKRALTREILQKTTPIEAKYIVKILLGGMRIGLQESLVESSLARAFGCPLTEVQFANMLLGDIGETALLARYGRLAEARMRLLHPLKVMLASPEEDLERILNYMNGVGLAEDKYDGIRAQLHKQEDQIKLYSRDLDDVTGSFPDIVREISAVPGSFLMDGEILPYRGDTILTFAELQKRLGRKVLSEEMLHAIPCRYFAFDLLYHNGRLLLDQPLTERRRLLGDMHQLSAHSFSISHQRVVQSVDDLEQAFADSRARNNEGLVIKHPDSAYTPGKRGKIWLKLKRALLTLDVVVTMAEYGHGKRAGLLSDYTFAVQHDGKLLNIGKAYSGITDKELLQLSDLFHRISLTPEKHYHVVPPHVVFEVTFDRINRSNRHDSGFALRFPRIKSIRWDKRPEEIDTLETVESLYSQHFSTETA